MTQAFNLSQLANKVNPSGQLNAATGLSGITAVANGGTGKSSVTSGRLLLGAGTSAMTELAGSAAGDAVTWNGSAWVSGTVGGSSPQVNVYVSPATWSKPATLKGIKVTVLGAGGSGGTAPTAGNCGGGGGGGAAIQWLSAPNIPGPISVTAGSGTNSFGALASATAGSTGSFSPSPGTTTATPVAGGAGGSGSGGTINISGQVGQDGFFILPSSVRYSGGGASTILGVGGSQNNVPNSSGDNAVGYGAGGAGAFRGTPGIQPGATGAPGIVIVEEFY